VILLLVTASAAVPQLPDPQPENHGVVDIPGVGRVDFDKLPPDIRDNIRIPGRTYYDPPEKYEDLPPLAPDPDPVPEPKVGLPPEIESEEVAPKSEAGEAKGAHAEIPIEEVLKRMRDERAFPSGEIPEDAYQKAWEHIQRMQPAVPPSEPASKDLTDLSAEPESWLTAPLRWLARAWDRLSGDSAVAQIPPHYWYSIGPSGITGDLGPRSAGIVEWIAVDPQSVIANPQNPQKIYLGTLEGGIWKTSDGGITWLPATDDSLVPVPSLQIEAIAVHPNNSSMIFAGTGINCCPEAYRDAQQNLIDTQRSFGMYRTSDSGATWCRIGPSCPDSAHCPGTDYTHSDLVVPQVAVEPTSPYRVWAATSKGLFYSDDAALTGSCTASCDCSGVHWTLATLPKKNDNLTPNYMLHVFLSPSTSQTVYAAIIQSDNSSSANGWWKSTNHGATWGSAPVLQLPNGPGAQQVARASIAKGGSGGDVLYTLYGPAPPACGNGAVPTRLSRTTNSGATWQNLMTPLDCTTGMQVVGVDPADPTGQTIAVGTNIDLWRSTDGGATFQDVGPGTALHVDHKALLFVPPPTPGPPSLLFVGNDGGIWKTTNFTAQTVDWSNNLNNLGLADVLFYRGTIDSLNYVASAGGTQDNGALKGGASVVWTGVGAFGDGGQILIDPTNSNIQYFTSILELTVNKTINGGESDTDIVGKAGGLPSDNAGVHVADGSLAMDPSDHNTLLVYALFSNDPTAANRVYRTTTGAEGSAAWVPISPPAQTPGAVPVVRSFAFAPVPAPTPRSNVVFAATGGDGVWQTANANDPAPTWAASRTGLPDRVLKSIAADTAQCSPSQPTCTSTCPCTLYVTASSFDDNAQPPFAARGHVFRTVYSGQAWSSVAWENISGDLTSPTCQANPRPASRIFRSTRSCCIRPSATPCTLLPIPACFRAASGASRRIIRHAIPADQHGSAARPGLRGSGAHSPSASHQQRRYWTSRFIPIQGTCAPSPSAAAPGNRSPSRRRQPTSPSTRAA